MHLPKEFERLEQYCANQITDVYAERLQTEKDSICAEWQSVWEVFCAELGECPCKAEFVEISLLRYSLLQDNETPGFLMEAFNERWIFGGVFHAKKVSLSTLTQIIFSFRETVYLEAKRYMGKISPSLAEKAFLQQLPNLEAHISDVLKADLDAWLLTPAFHSLFSQKLLCSFGGYRFFQNTLYEGK